MEKEPIHLQLARAALFLALGLGCLFFLLLVGCSGEGSGGGGREVGSASSPIVLLPREVLELDPRFIGDPYGIKVSRLIFASLVTIDPRTLEVVPDLAESIEIPEPTLYRVRLRGGLTFSDGTALDAEDVVATFRSVTDPELGSRYAGSYRRLVSVEAEDARTVLFRIDAPHAPFLTDLELPILRAEDVGAHLTDEGLIGAGPYRLIERDTGRLVLERNERWHGGQARFERLRMILVRDDNTRAMRLRAGGGDVAINAVPALLQPLFEESQGGEAGFTISSAPGIGTTYLGLHTEHGPLRDVRVRRALALALDRELLIEAKLGGRARPALGWIPPGHWAFTEDLPRYGYDPERARALLDEAGYPDPPGPEPRMRVLLRTSSDRLRHSLARAVAAMLAEVGVEVDVRVSENATMISDLNRGRFDLGLLTVPEVFEPHVLSWFFATERIPEGGQIGANRWRLRSAALDQAFEEGVEATDLDDRRRIYARVQRILAEELPVIPLWHEDVVVITSDRIGPLDVPRDGRFGTLAR